MIASGHDIREQLSQSCYFTASKHVDGTVRNEGGGGREEGGLVLTTSWSMYINRHGELSCARNRCSARVLPCQSTELSTRQEVTFKIIISPLATRV